MCFHMRDHRSIARGHLLQTIVTLRLLKICLHRDKDGEGRPFNRTDLPLASRSLNLETFIYRTDACLVQGSSFLLLLRCDPALLRLDITM